MLLSPCRLEIQIYKEESLTSVHCWHISRDVGNCHNSFRVVLCKCQSLTCALTSARGPLWSGVLSSQSLCAVTVPCICDSDTFGVSGVGFFCRAEPRWPEGPGRISCSDRSAVIQLHTQKLDWHFSCILIFCMPKACLPPLWTQRMSSRELWDMFTKLQSLRVAPKCRTGFEVSAGLSAFQQT